MSNSSSISSTFSNWIEQSRDQLEDGLDAAGNSTIGAGAFSFFTQFGAIQENVTNQLQELSGSLPEAGPLSASFRQRLTNAIYLLIASGVFFALTIIVGLPSVLIRPTKFVVCLSIATILAAGSVILIQKPSTFLSNLLSGNSANSAPVAGLGLSLIFTLYVAIFVHRYVYVLAAGGIQVACLLYYLATFIPGGTKGLSILLKAAYLVVSTAMKPCIFVTKKTISACLSRYLS
jgi:hypothetical protein